ncbi:MAG TPA: di-heme oxidoredictase family protein [Polyangia bacterium]|nr:di-heme oxidoredictase family protein [Polyangia bacterium]
MTNRTAPTKSLGIALLGAVTLAQAASLVGCQSHKSGATADGGTTVSGSAGQGGTVVGGTAGGGTVVITSDGGVMAGGAAGMTTAIGPNTPVGTCATGFTRCYGLCVDATLVGADCRPALCATPAVSATPPVRTNLSARGFTWSVDSTGGMTTVTFTPGKPGNSLQPTIAVDLYYRVNGGSGQTATMTTTTGATATGFTWSSADLKTGDDLDFYFHTTVATQTIIVPSPNPDGKPLIDTMWFHQRIGSPADPEPAYPLTVTLAGRFRDRHPNEERYDHYVDTYFAGPTFDLTFVDHGNALDVTIAPQATMDVQAVDFKTYECFGSGQDGAIPAPTPLCSTPPALAAIGVRATNQGGSVFTSHVDGLSYGQLLDFELTFVRSRTYYTEWFSYFVGSGKLQPKIQHPWATAAGSQSVTNVTTDEFGYAQHVPNLTPATLASFISGKVLFEADFDTHVGYNPPTTFDCPRGLTPGTKVPTIVTPPPPSPLFTAGNSYSNTSLATIPRPGYTSSACFSCHHLDGKGLPADETGMNQTLLKLFAAAAGATTSTADATYGTILDTHGPAGGTAEATPSVTWQTSTVTLGDGTSVELRKPVLATGTLRDGPLGATTHISTRIPRPVFGLGLLEAVPAETILGLADPNDANGDGISGRPNFVVDPATGQPALGRFGWKAGTASLREQAALAFVNDIGVTSPLYPKHRCGANQATCTSAVASATTPQLSDTDLDHIQSYLRNLSPPPRRNYEDPKAVAGMALFAAIGCNRCHVPNLVTSMTAEVPEMRGIPIQPFTDLLLHDMGDGLADDAPVEEGTATGREWRTAPLWGNGTGTAVMFPAIDAFDPNGNPPPGGVYLHDGRARSITEAVLWHGGEAKPMYDAFVALTADERADLLAYVAYPFADPVPVRSCFTPMTVSAPMSTMTTTPAATVK